MNLLKKITAVIFVAALGFGIVSCSASSEPEVVPEFEITDAGEDMNGYVMDFSYALTNVSDDEVVLGYIPNTQLADIAAKRIKDIESRYNCKINIMYCSDFGSGYDLLKASVVSGLRYCDLISNESYFMVNLTRAGYLVGLSDYLDMTDYDKWGTQNMLYSMCWDDDVYAVVPASWPELIYKSFGYPLCVNSELVAKSGENDLREYVENGTWTWDQFEATLQKLTQKDGENIIYAMGCGSVYYYCMMATTNGVNMCEYVNGQVICGYFTDAGIEALERAKSIRQETCKDCFWPYDMEDTAVEMFINGELCMTCPTADYIFGNSNAILYKADNVAILPFPKGPRAEGYENQGAYQSLNYCTSIPVTCNDVELTAKILDALYEPFDEYKTKEDVMAYMTEQVFFDELDTRMFVSMRESAQYNFFLEKARTAIETIASSKSSVTEILNSLEDVYDGIEEEYMVHHYNGQQAVWGK